MSRKGVKYPNRRRPIRSLTERQAVIADLEKMLTRIKKERASIRRDITFLQKRLWHLKQRRLDLRYKVRTTNHTLIYHSNALIGGK